MSRRKFTAASGNARCAFDRKLRDGSSAQCMRHAVTGYFSSYCKQHDRMLAKAVSVVAGEILSVRS